MKIIATCVAGHQKVHRGLFAKARHNYWWKKHQHPEYEED